MKQQSNQPLLYSAQSHFHIASVVHEDSYSVIHKLNRDDICVESDDKDEDSDIYLLYQLHSISLNILILLNLQ